MKPCIIFARQLKGALLLLVLLGLAEAVGPRRRPPRDLLPTRSTADDAISSLPGGPLERFGLGSTSLGAVWIIYLPLVLYINYLAWTDRSGLCLFSSFLGLLPRETFCGLERGFSLVPAIGLFGFQVLFATLLHALIPTLCPAWR